ncbi:MAG: glucose 1-dehydrogenase [Hyphomicrobiaceae bacterium]|nr:glucose 1-dehydrogenase [Hyphomicrobiaceae bacterium]
MDFKGKVAVVTGAANGIGRATSLGFAHHGAKVVLVDRDGDGAKAAAGAIRQLGGEAIGVAADVTRSADVAGYVKAALDAYGRIDCFHNNAGIEGVVKPIHEYDEAVFDQLMNVNVKGVYLGLKHVIPVMIKQRSGAIVNTASIAGLMGSPNMSPYVASKHAVIGFTKAVSGEVAGYGIRVNAVCPGPVDTRMIKSVTEQVSPGDAEGAAQRYKGAIPIGRFSTPDEIANMVHFLCSDLSSGITGAHFAVDGGRTATAGAVTVVGKG